MPHDGTPMTTGEAPDRLTLGQTVARLAQEIAVLEPGPACGTPSRTSARRGSGGVLEAACQVRPRL